MRSGAARTAPAGRLPNWVALIAVLSLATLSCGCVTTGPLAWIENGFKVGPNYCRPPAPVAPEWIQSDDPRTQGSPPRDGEWWNVFGDPILTDLVYRAYRESPNLQSIGARVLQARAQQAIAVGNFFPQTQQLQGTYYQGTVAHAPTHIDLTTFNLSWELDFWGKYRR